MRECGSLSQLISFCLLGMIPLSVNAQQSSKETNSRSLKDTKILIISETHPEFLRAEGKHALAVEFEKKRFELLHQAIRENHLVFLEALSFEMTVDEIRSYLIRIDRPYVEDLKDETIQNVFKPTQTELTRQMALLEANFRHFSLDQTKEIKTTLKKYLYYFLLDLIEHARRDELFNATMNSMSKLPGAKERDFSQYLDLVLKGIQIESLQKRSDLVASEIGKWMEKESFRFSFVLVFIKKLIEGILPRYIEQAYSYSNSKVKFTRYTKKWSETFENAIETLKTKSTRSMKHVLEIVRWVHLINPSYEIATSVLKFANENPKRKILILVGSAHVESVSSSLQKRGFSKSQIQIDSF